MYMNRQKLETVMMCGLIAAIAAVGIFFGILFFFHIELSSCDGGKMLLSYLALAGSIWGMLLLRKD